MRERRLQGHSLQEILVLPAILSFTKVWMSKEWNTSLQSQICLDAEQLLLAWTVDLQL